MNMSGSNSDLNFATDGFSSHWIWNQPAPKSQIISIHRFSWTTRADLSTWQWIKWNFPCCLCEHVTHFHFFAAILLFMDFPSELFLPISSYREWFYINFVRTTTFPEKELFTDSLKQILATSIKTTIFPSQVSVWHVSTCAHVIFIESW